jgi:uncharacterized protein (DUF1697 family)
MVLDTSSGIYVALLRGVNVGGKVLPMKELRLAFEEAGCTGVQTYIQSGNVVCRSAASRAQGLSTQVAAAVTKRHGFTPGVMVLTRRELERAAADNPFPEAEDDPKSLHLFFLGGSPTTADRAGLEALAARRERFVLKGKVFYLHAPAGFGASKLAARAERLLGVPATARNWRTVMALLEMARAAD